MTNAFQAASEIIFGGKIIKIIFKPGTEAAEIEPSVLTVSALNNAFAWIHLKESKTMDILIYL